jgi:hypothetical protein
MKAIMSSKQNLVTVTFDNGQIREYKMTDVRDFDPPETDPVMDRLLAMVVADCWDTGSEGTLIVEDGMVTYESEDYPDPATVTIEEMMHALTTPA